VIAQRLALRAWPPAKSRCDMAELRRINKADTVSREDAALIARLDSAIQVGDRAPLLTNEEIACLLIPRAT